MDEEQSSPNPPPATDSFCWLLFVAFSQLVGLLALLMAAFYAVAFLFGTWVLIFERHSQNEHVGIALAPCAAIVSLAGWAAFKLIAKKPTVMTWFALAASLAIAVAAFIVFAPDGPLGTPEAQAPARIYGLD